MLKLSEIFTLPVINLYELKHEGNIENILINPTTKQIEKIIVYDEKDDTIKSLDAKNIYKLSNECCLISNSSKITLYENDELVSQNLVNPMNAKCYSINGEYLGRIDDFIIKNFKLISLISNDIEYGINLLSGISAQIAIISENNIKISRFKQKTKILKTNFKPQKDYVVNILSSSNTNKIDVTNTNFLVGRTITKDIKTESGELIASKNNTVSTNLIYKATFYGKLKELALYSK